MKYDTIKIIAAIHAAIAAADAADAAHPDHEDGGTSNFDAAYLRVPRMLKKQGAVIEAAFPQYKVSLSDYSFQGRVLMLHHSHGQGNRRSRMADAAFASFEKSGLPCGQYLQMD